MANYQNLLNSIAAVIRTNGNKEITGAVLQSTLQSMVSVMGANATYGGVAHPTDSPGTPDGPVVYVASESGIYTNFGAISIDTDELAMLLWNPTTGTWSKESLAYIADKSEIEQLIQDGVDDINDAKTDAINAINTIVQSVDITYETLSGTNPRNIQLKNGGGDAMMPKTKAEITQIEQSGSEVSLQQYLNENDVVEQIITFPELSTTPAQPTGWSRIDVATANKYDIVGYVTEMVTYSGANGIIEYGTINKSTTPYTLVTYGNVCVSKGTNVIKFPSPVPVDNTKWFGFKQKVRCMSFQSTGVGSYYDSSYHNNVTWQYYLKYIKVDAISPFKLITEHQLKINGGLVEKLPYIDDFNRQGGFYGNNIQNTRWGICYNNVEPGDVIDITASNGYTFVAFIVEVSSNSVLAYAQGMKDYATGHNSATLPFSTNSQYMLKVMIQHNNTELSRAGVHSNVSVHVYKKCTDVVSVPQKEISILFVGNSLTQDAVSYLPWLMSIVCPQIKFKFYVWYNGGYTLAQQLADFQNNVAADIFSVSENNIRWTNYNDSKTMASVLSDYTFDIVSIQEYFNYKNEYSDSDKQTFNDVIDYISSNYNGNLKFVTLFHQPKRDSAEAIFNLTKSATEWQMQNTIVESVLAPGIAIYRALSTDLNSLGDQGGLSPDGTHSQEGLPCIMQSYVLLLWIYEQLGIPKSIYNFRQYVENSIYRQNSYTYLNIPGPNLGNGLVTGTEDDRLLAENVAIKAYKEGKYLELNNLTSYT